MKKAILTRPLRSQESYVAPPKPTLRGGGKKESHGARDLDSILDSLTATEKKTLLAKLSLQERNHGADAPTRDADMWGQAVYDAIQQAVSGRSLHVEGLPGPLAVKRVLASSGSWGNVSGFMKNAGLSELTVTERQAVYNLLARLLVTYAKEVAENAGIPVTTKLVANCATNIVAIFDQSFPGYLASGLVKIVVRSLTTRVQS